MRSGKCDTDIILYLILDVEYCYSRNSMYLCTDP